MIRRSTFLLNLAFLVIFSAALWFYHNAQPFYFILAKNLLIFHLLILSSFFVRDFFYSNKTAMPRRYIVPEYLKNFFLLGQFCGSAALALPNFSGSPWNYLAAVFSLTWLIAGALFAKTAVLQIFYNGMRPVSEFFSSLAIVFWLGGAVWLTASLLPHTFLGFSEPFKTLTAIHFHYAGFAILMLASKTAKALRHYHPDYNQSGSKKILQWFGFIYPTAFFLVALGLTLTYLWQLRFVEKVGGILMVASSLLLVMVWIKFYLRNLIADKKYLLAIAVISFMFTLGLALAYSLRIFNWLTAVDFSLMTLLHGAINVFGVVGAGYWYFTLTDNYPNQTSLNIFRQNQTFSKIRSSFKTDAKAILIRSENPQQKKSGLIDNSEDFKSINRRQLHPDVLHFYQKTAEAQILVQAKWYKGFLWLSKIYKKISRFLGQFNFPNSKSTSEMQMQSSITAIRDEIDSRKNVRAWHRSFASGETAYLAFYSLQEEEEVFMNIAFPILWGNMTSVLRLANLDNGGLMLTTFSGVDIGHEGIFMNWRSFSWRLPINETIAVWPYSEENLASLQQPEKLSLPANARQAIVATHDMFLFGRRFLTLDYLIYF